MKRIFLFAFLCMFALIAVGCEVSGDAMGAYVSIVNPEWHQKAAFRVGFAEEDSLKEKYIDIWLKADKDVTVSITEEYAETFELEMQKDIWYSLTTEIDKAEGKQNEENFLMYKEAVLRTFTINAEEKVTVTIKVVAGDREQNFTETGWLLTNRKNASKEVTLKVGTAK